MLFRGVLMATYYARMMDAATGGEGAYEFEGPQDLMERTADEVVEAFFTKVEAQLPSTHIDWELNGALKNREIKVVTAMGSLIPGPNEPLLPFLLLIADHKS